MTDRPEPKLCRDCRFTDPDPQAQGFQRRCQHIACLYYCIDERKMVHGACGPDGKLWEPRES